MKNILFFAVIFISAAFVLVSVKGDARIHEIAGDIVTAKCECGFETTMKLGGGKANFQSSCKFPFYCNACSSLVLLNTLSEKICCKKCNSENVTTYDNDSLRANISNNPVFGWNINNKIYSLTDDFYFCPQCREFKLRFTEVGNWD